MNLIRFLFPLIFCVSWANLAATESHFCYSKEECGPTSDLWNGACQSGKRQSPIDLPYFSPDEKPPKLPLEIGNYQGSSFTMKNNGHTISIEFGEDGPFKYKKHNFLKNL